MVIIIGLEAFKKAPNVRLVADRILKEVVDSYKKVFTSKRTIL